MGLFPWTRRRRSREEPPEEWWDRIARVESDMRQLRLEQDAWFDKIRRGLASLGKRQKALDEQEAGGAVHDAGQMATPLEERGALLRAYRNGHRG